MTKIIAHLDMDAFFAAVEQRDNPKFTGKPVIVGADPKKGNGRGVVSTCSYEARVFGVHSAMPISKAYQLCPQGIYLPVNGKKYKQASDQIFKLLYDFTPDIEPVSIDEAFMDLTGCTHFYGNAYNTCLKIKDRIKREVHLTASIGIAPNKMTAKLASDFCKPDGLLEITEDNLMKFLWALPVEKLWGVGKKTKKVFNTMGIQKVEDIAKTPVEVLQKRFGESGLHFYQLAQGIDEREISINEEAKSISNEHTFDQDTDNKDEIYEVLSFLSERVSYRLRKDDLKAKTVSLKIRLSDFRTFTRAYTFNERINFFDKIYQKSKQLFDEFYKPGMKVRLVGVRTTNFNESYVQESLFEHPQNTKLEKVHQALDAIKNKFGESSIHHGR